MHLTNALRTRYGILLPIVALCLVLAGLLAGCGSGGSGLPSSKGFGRASFTILWPVVSPSTRGRLVPAAALSIRIDVTGGGKTLGSQTLDRPAGGGTSTATFNNLPAGPVMDTATAFPQAAAMGTPLASGTQTVTILAGQTIPVTITMNSTINQITITPASPTVAPGASITLAAGATDANGNMVLLTAGKLTWTSATPAIATIDNTGKVTGVTAGSSQITVTDTESGKSGSVTVTVAAAGGGSTSGGGTGGLMTDQQRQAVMDAVGAKWNSLPHQDRMADAQAMLTFLNGLSGVSSAAISDDLSILATFSDGEPFGIVNNEPLNDPITTSPPTTSRAAPTSHNGTSRQQVLPDVGIPSGTEAWLAHMFGPTEDIVPLSTPVPILQQILEKAGYNVTKAGGLGGPFVSDLRSPPGSSGKIGAMYIGGHGVSATHLIAGPLRTNLHFAIATDQQINLLNTNEPQQPLERLDPSLQADLSQPNIKDPRVVRLYARFTVPSNLIDIRNPMQQWQWHYGITADFVRHYWASRFSPNSVLFCGACSGFNQEFMDACFAQGLGTYWGWSNPVVRGTSNSTVRFVFDRLAGANIFMPPTPPTRAFPTVAALQAAYAAGLGTTTYTEAGQTFNASLLEANTPMATSLEPGMLTPSIENMSVDEDKGRLTINGTFGTDPGVANRQVTVGGTPLDPAKIQWTQTQLICKLPDLSPSSNPQANEPAGSAGDVIVSAYGHKSNPVQLTEYYAKFTLKSQVTIDRTTTRTGDGGSSTVIEKNNTFGTVLVTLHLRADIHDSRVVAGDTLIPGLTGVLGARDSIATLVDAGGMSVFTQTSTGSSGTSTKTDSGFTTPNKGAFAPIVVAPDGSYLNTVAVGSIDTMAHTIKLFVTGSIPAATNETDTINGATTTATLDAGYAISSLFMPPFVGTDVTFKLDNNDNILPPATPLTSSNPNNPDSAVTTLTFSTIKAMFPPDPNAARAFLARGR